MIKKRKSKLNKNSLNKKYKSKLYYNEWIKSN